jgi:hypothetical protein
VLPKENEMKNVIAFYAFFLMCFPLPAQNLNSNQVKVNGKTFTIGTNTYDADYSAVFNQWYKGHKSAEEAKQGEDLSWLNDFTRTYTVNFLEGSLAINDTVIDNVKIISFFKSGGMRDRYGGIGLLNIVDWLVYDGKTGKLIGAQLQIEAYNAYNNVGPEFFDIPEFSFPLKVQRINSPASNYDVARGLGSYKIVYEYNTNQSTTNGARVCIYNFDSATAKKLKDADDFARASKKEIPSIVATLKQTDTFKNATHRLTADINVFAEQDGGSAVVVSLKNGDPVQVVQYGEYADWNGITAKWAKVKTAGDKTGWIFSVYLAEIKK